MRTWRRIIVIYYCYCFGLQYESQDFSRGGKSNKNNWNPIKKIIVFPISCTHIAISSQFQPHVAPPSQRRSKTSKQQTKTEKPGSCNPERWRQQLSPMIGVSSNVCKHPFRKLHQLLQKARYQITAFLLLARANRWQIAGHNLKKANPQTQFKKSSPNKQQDRGGQTCGLAGSASGRVCGQRLLGDHGCRVGKRKK